MYSLSLSPDVIELHIPGIINYLIILLIFISPLIIIAAIFGALIKILASSSYSKQAKKAAALSINILLSIIIVFLSLYLPKTLYDPKEQLSVACGAPFSFIVGSSYASPPFPWTKSCIGWIDSIWESRRIFLWFPFLLNITFVFILLIGAFRAMRLIRPFSHTQK